MPNSNSDFICDDMPHDMSADMSVGMLDGMSILMSDNTWNKPKMICSRDLSSKAIMDYHGLSWIIMDYPRLSEIISATLVQTE